MKHIFKKGGFFLLIIAGLGIGGGVIPFYRTNLFSSRSNSKGLEIAAVSGTGNRLRIAAAADLKWVFPELVQFFQHEHPAVLITVAYGSSGHFFALLSNQAPFDLFLSANTLHPRNLVEQGLSWNNRFFIYATGRLVIWCRRSSGINVEKMKLHALLLPSVQHIAIANPQHAPYGKAAQALLKTLGLDRDIQGKLVYGEDASQAAQFVQSGAADLGILPLSLVLTPPMEKEGEYTDVPSQTYPLIEQGGVILKWALDPKTSQAFQAFLEGPQGQMILRRFGFQSP